MKTNYSTPKTNIFAAVNDLRIALSYGCKAKLTKVRNEDCTFPILKKEQDQDFRNYEFSYGTSSSINQIKNNSIHSDFDKNLSLNYVCCFGTQEAMDKYYETGKLSSGNFRGIGRSHLVRVDDLINFWESQGKKDRAEMYRRQYRTAGYEDTAHLFDFYSYKHGSPYAIENFRRKLWAIELLDEKEQPKLSLGIKALLNIINVLAYPLKYVPRKSVLRMPEYTIYTFRVGSVYNGISVEFQIPKKFSFKEKR
jgi:hypothetical protein